MRLQHLVLNALFSVKQSEYSSNTLKKHSDFEIPVKSSVSYLNYYVKTRVQEPRFFQVSLKWCVYNDALWYLYKWSTVQLIKDIFVVYWEFKFINRSLYRDWFGFFCSPAGSISRIDSLRDSLTPSVPYSYRYTCWQTIHSWTAPIII